MTIGRNNRVLTIFGGSGFIGSYLSKFLAQDFVVRIVTSDMNKAEKIKTQAPIGRILIHYCDIFDKSKLEEYIVGSDIIINLVATFSESNKGDFTYLHSQFPEIIANLSKKNGVSKFIQLSNLNIENISTLYAKSRVLGDKAVQGFHNHVILRSSLVYGEEDRFLSVLYRMAKKFGSLPLLNNGKMRLQPIYVCDLCEVILKICQDEDNVFRGIYKVGGREILSMLDIIGVFEKLLDKKIRLIKVNKLIVEYSAKIFSFGFMSIFNRLIFGSREFPFSPEQIKLSDYDNIIADEKENILNIMNIKTDSFANDLSRCFLD